MTNRMRFSSHSQRTDKKPVWHLNTAGINDINEKIPFLTNKLIYHKFYEADTVTVLWDTFDMMGNQWKNNTKTIKQTNVQQIKNARSLFDANQSLLFRAVTLFPPWKRNGDWSIDRRISWRTDRWANRTETDFWILNLNLYCSWMCTITHEQSKWAPQRIIYKQNKYQ